MTRQAAVSTNDFTMPTYRRWPVEFASGRGSTLVAGDGTEYLDLVAGIAVASVGHAHPAVADAVARQVRTLVHTSNLYPTRPAAALAERLAEMTGGKLAFFCNSGAEAVECALKLARKWGRGRRGATRIVATAGGFHGRTFGALAATGQPAKQAPFEPLPGGFDHVPFGDADALDAAVDERVCALVLEPIQGEAGVIVPPPGYLRRARELCTERDVLLVLDEIQTGFGRTGAWFAAQHDDVDADVVCIGKALAGGLPMGACLARPEIAASFEPGDHGSTFGGGPVQSAAARATIDVIEGEGLVERARVAGAALSSGLRRVAGPGIEVRGRGLMIGLDLGAPRARAVAEAAFDRGVLVNDAAPSVVRLVPPLVITDDEIARAIEVVGEVLDASGPA